jgi:hypothetical protein
MEIFPSKWQLSIWTIGMLKTETEGVSYGTDAKQE